MKGTHESKEEKTDGVFEPLIRTPSANRTREGLLFSLAFLAAVSSDDFLMLELAPAREEPR